MSTASENLEYAKYIQEWVKVGVSALTPIAIAALTYFISKSLNEKQSILRKGEQIIIEKQKIYAKLGECLNIIYIYVADIGDFRRYNPQQIVDKKRESDRKFHVYGPYWSVNTKKNYEGFMNTAFEMYTGSGRNAKINSAPHEKREAFKIDAQEWNPDWDKLFTGRREEKIHENYTLLVKSFLNDIVTPDIK